MKFTLKVIHILLIIFFSRTITAKNIAFTTDSIIVYNLENTENAENTKAISYPKINKIIAKYEQFINKKDREFPFGTIALAGNKYDGLMLGATLINLKQPAKNVDFTASMMYGLASKKITGTADFKYFLKPKNSNIKQVVFSTHFQSFSYNNKPKILKYYSVQPKVEMVFKGGKLQKRNLEELLVFKSNINFEKAVSYSLYPTLKDTNYTSYFNKISYTISKKEQKYFINSTINLEQNKHFIRSSFELNSKIKYGLKNNNKGIAIRFFTGAFLYKNKQTKFRLMPQNGFNLSGITGENDFAYNNYYFGRNEQSGFISNQISKNDGFFKTTSNLNGIEIGQTIDFMMATNITFDFPVKYVPIKLFIDFGFSLDNHLNVQNLLPVKKFQYDAGFMFSFLDEGFEIYFPLLMSKDFKNYYKANKPKFGQKISFLLDIKKLDFHKQARNFIQKY